MKSKHQVLGHFLKQKRIKMGFTQSEVAVMLKYTSAQFISNWERGICSPPTSKLIDLAALYKINKREFIDVILEQTKIDIEKYFNQKKRYK